MRYALCCVTYRMLKHVMLRTCCSALQCLKPAEEVTEGSTIDYLNFLDSCTENAALNFKFRSY